jgi:hypothetical protein
MPEKPSLRFFHSAALRHRSDRLLSAIEKDGDPRAHAHDLADLVVELSEAGMDYYFLRPIRQAKLGVIAQKTAQYGMSGALKLMAPMVRTILHGANAAQLRAIAAHMRHLQGED